MRIQVRFFASIRESLGQSLLALDTESTTVGQLRDELLARGEVWANVLARGRAVRSSLNQVMVSDSALLNEGCEVAFFPPVTGG